MCAHSLRCRVLVSLLLAFLLGFGVLATYLFDSRDQLRRGIVYIQAQELAAGLTADSDLNQLPLKYAGGNFSYTLYAADGKMEWYSSNLAQPRRLKSDTLDDEINRFRWAFRSGRVISVPVFLADGSTLMVAKEDLLENKLISDYLQVRFRYGLIVLIPFCLLGLMLVMGLLHWTLRPVKRATLLAADIGPHNPDQRIPLDRLPQEVLPLAKAANDGLDRLSQAYEYEQRIVADAAHQLRTPLTVLSLRLQKARKEGRADWDAIDCDISQACKLVNQLLLLAQVDRAQAAASSNRYRSYLPRIVREAVADLSPLFEDHGRSIEVEIDADVWVKGEPGQLREALRNVLENALFHGKGVVQVRLFHEPGSIVSVDISDEGEGIPLDSQEEMFQRFGKREPNTMGSGLGLAIVRRILRNAGGEACFVSKRPCIIRLGFIEQD